MWGHGVAVCWCIDVLLLHLLVVVHCSDPPLTDVIHVLSTDFPGARAQDTLLVGAMADTCHRFCHLSRVALLDLPVVELYLQGL